MFRIAKRLVVTSDTMLTIFATLFMSFGVGLVANLSLWSPEEWGIHDTYSMFIALPSILLGAILFRFLTPAQEWKEELKAFRDKRKDPSTLKEAKENFIETRSEIRKGAILTLQLCALFLVVSIVGIVFDYHYRARNEKPKENGEKTVALNREPVVIGYQEIALYRHLFTAKAKGYFDQEGVNIEIKPFVSANRMMEGMISGDLDGTGLSNLQVALTVEGKDPGRFKIVNMLVWKEKSYPD